MFDYTSGDCVYVELSTREVDQWRKKDWSKIEEAERNALIAALGNGKSRYVIKGAGELYLDHGSTGALQEKYPDVTKDSVA